MDITVVGRNAEISSRLRDYVEDKAVKVEQFDPRVQRVEVEVTHERNPRQADTAERVEITVVSKGPVIRAEASSSDRFAAFDIAMGKLTERLRRARDRKKDHRRYTVAAPSEDLQAAPVLTPGAPRSQRIGGTRTASGPPLQGRGKEGSVTSEVSTRHIVPRRCQVCPASSMMMRDSSERSEMTERAPRTPTSVLTAPPT